nr:MAG TPA: hypothetical protein [Caudoviricetes sp.]
MILFNGIDLILLKLRLVILCVCFLFYIIIANFVIL